MASTVLADGAKFMPYTYPFYLVALDALFVGGWIFAITAVANGLIGFAPSMHYFKLTALATLLVIRRIMIKTIAANRLPCFIP